MTEQQPPQKDQSDQQSPGVAGTTEDGRVYVVTPTAMAVEGPPASGEEGSGSAEEQNRSVTDMVSQPDKVMRIGNMIRQLLEEVKSAPLDEASRQRLRSIHQASIKELEDGLSGDLVAELERLSLPFTDDSAPSDGELRIAQAQLVGWLEGLFHGIQTALFAQQMAARQQLEQMRRALPPGSTPEQGPSQVPGRNNDGMYL